VSVMAELIAVRHGAPAVPMGETYVGHAGSSSRESSDRVGPSEPSERSS